MKEKIKNHVLEHKALYSCAATGIVVAGFTCILMRGRHASMQSVVDGHSRATVRSLFLLSDNNVVTTMHTGYRGNPGFRTRNIEFDTEYDTQWQAAKAFGVSPSMLSSHLNNKLDNVNGLHFERIPA